MATYSQLIKQAAWYNPASWFGKSPSQSIPASHYDNRLTQRQFNDQNLGSNAMPTSHYDGRITGSKVNTQNLGPNSMPANHYANRQTELTTRGQMGLAPGSYKAYQNAQDQLAKEWEPGRRKDLMVKALDANTPGFHQYGYNEDGTFDSALYGLLPSERPYDFKNNGYRDNPTGYGIRFNSYQEQPSKPSTQELYRARTGRLDQGEGYKGSGASLYRDDLLDAKYKEVYGTHRPADVPALGGFNQFGGFGSGFGSY